MKKKMKKFLNVLGIFLISFASAILGGMVRIPDSTNSTGTIILIVFVLLLIGVGVDFTQKE